MGSGDVNGAGRGLNEAAGLGESSGGYGFQVEYRGQLGGELFEEIHLAVEMKHLGGKGAALLLFICPGSEKPQEGLLCAGRDVKKN